MLGQLLVLLITLLMKGLMLKSCNLFLFFFPIYVNFLTLGLVQNLQTPGTCRMSML